LKILNSEIKKHTNGINPSLDWLKIKDVSIIEVWDKLSLTNTIR
jgi:hypothetical protein